MEKTQTKPERLACMDIARALAVLLVIYGHTFRESMRAAHLWCDWSYLYVYRFHVSALFMLSGMGYAMGRERSTALSVRQFACKKAGAILKPWVAYSLLMYLVFSAVQLVPAIRGMLSSSAYQLASPGDYLLAMLKNENPYCFHVWYLQTLFLFVMTAFLLDRFLPQKISRIISFIMMLLLPAVYSLFCTQLPWVFKGYVQKLPFFLLGTLLPREKLTRRAGALSALGLACAAGLFCLTVYPMDTLYASHLTGLPLSYGENLLIAGVCVGLAALCHVLRRPLRFLASFGQNTMPYYLYHQPLCCAVTGMVLYDRLHLSTPATVLICLMLSILVPFVLVRFVGKTRLGTLLRRLGLPM